MYIHDLAFAITAQKLAWVPPFFLYSMDSLVCKEQYVHFEGSLNVFLILGDTSLHL